MVEAATSTHATIADPRDEQIDALQRELRAVREIAHAFLVADRPTEVYQLALDRVTPLLGASFSLVMHLDDEGEVLRPVAQHEWPARHRHWIGALRVRVGDGPSGMAVAERKLVEVADLFADPALELWYEVATELGFRSIVAAPLLGGSKPIGAIAFYYTEAAPIRDAQRSLVRLVADQLAATAEKASRLDALRRANGALAEANDAHEREARSADASRRARDVFLLSLMACIRASGQREAADTLADALATAQVAEELAQIECRAAIMVPDDINPRQPMLDAIATWRRRMPALTLTHAEPTVLLPSLQTDVQWVTRLLSLLIGQAIQLSDGADAIHADVELGRGFVAHRLRWSGAPLAVEPSFEVLAAQAEVFRARHSAITVLDVALIPALVRWLGGELRRDEIVASSAKQGVTLVFVVEDTA